jgi:hypothetical protein
MSAHPLTAEARRENAAALAAALGLGLETAGERLDVAIAITASPADPVAEGFADDIAVLLGRTVREVSREVTAIAPVAEIVIGDAASRTGGRTVYLQVRRDGATLSRTRDAAQACQSVHGLLRTIVACYACAATLDCALDGQLPFGLPDPLLLSFEAFGVDLPDLECPVELGHAYLAGAGAIGNGLLWAARHLDLRGRLEVADDDRVDSGNLNRQVWFTTDDIDLNKVDRLVLKAQPFFAGLKLVPRPKRIQDLAEKSDGPWLRRLIVAVDSRRARRQLQNEFPGEVFDASTTNIREVVIHHHRQPTSDACLGCIYEPDEEELSREQHIADHLGVSVEAVRSERISPEAAATIVERFPKLADMNLVGTAYDTLFKKLCGEGLLKTAAGRRVTAPFAFVSVLAGALLAVDLVRRLGSGRSDRNFNYWRVSVWHAPLARRRTLRTRQAACAFCGNPLFRRVNAALWPG